MKIPTKIYVYFIKIVFQKPSTIHSKSIQIVLVEKHETENVCIELLGTCNKNRDSLKKPPDFRYKVNNSTRHATIHCDDGVSVRQAITKLTHESPWQTEYIKRNSGATSRTFLCYCSPSFHSISWRVRTINNSVCLLIRCCRLP